MAERGFTPIRGRTIRITQLDDCCTPQAEGAECAVSVFDAFTLASFEANVEEGETQITRKANGDLCANESDPNLLVDLGVTLTLCQVLPETVSLLTGWPVVRDSRGVAQGVDVTEGASFAEVAIEIWSGVAGTACGDGAAYGYTIFPCTTGWSLDGELEYGGLDTTFTLTLTGRAKGRHAWGVGPYAVQLDENGDPGPLLTPIVPGGLARIGVTDVPPPANTGGCVSATRENGYTWPPEEDPIVQGWQPNTEYRVGDQVRLKGGQIVTVSEPGTSGSTEPNAPEDGQTVEDGSVVWRRDDTRAVWTADAYYASGDRVQLSTGEWLTVRQAGRSGTTEPVAPGPGETVSDGDVLWEQDGERNPDRGQWQPNTTYWEGDTVRLSTGEKVTAYQTGESGDTEPEAPAPGGRVSDNSTGWSRSNKWQASEPYKTGDRVQLSSGEWLQAGNDGRSGTSEPPAPGPEQTIQDNEVEWRQDAEDNPPADRPRWQPNTAYAVGDEVELSSGQVLRVTEAGTSGNDEPVAPGDGQTVEDGTIVWEQISEG